jgi:Ca2+-transporting ATPase
VGAAGRRGRPHRRVRARDQAGRLGARSNPFLLAAVLGAVAVQLAIVYLPVLQRLFDTHALSPFQLAFVLVASTAAFVAVEVEKWIIRRWSRRSRRIPA